MKRHTTIQTYLVLSLVLASMLLSSNTTFAIDDGTLTCWYSDSSQVGFWQSTPSIGWKKIDGGSNFNFGAAFSHGRTQWENAGKPTDSPPSTGSVSIACFGGYQSTLEARFNVDLTGLNGATAVSSTYFAQLNYNGATKQLRKLQGTQVIMIVSNGHSQEQYNNTFTHELGHALGWFGHSSHSQNGKDIMLSYGTKHQNLTDFDINHLNQIY